MGKTGRYNMIDLFQYQAFYEDWQELNKACGKIKKQNNIVKMGFYTFKNDSVI